MPELPEVEMYARYFAAHALGQTITDVRVLDARVVVTRKLPTLRGRAFREVRRHGKHLFARAVIPSRADGEGSPADAEGIPRSARDDMHAREIWLHLHFGMTGDLAYFRDHPPRFARVIFDFDGGAHLAYEDMRLFGVVDLTPSPEQFVLQHGLGPDPLQIRLPRFRGLIAGRRGRIKALLMSQDVVAGLGNLYADEALYRAAVNPRRAADRLRDDEVRSLFAAIRGVLREAIDFKSRGGDYPARYLVQHRIGGDRCPRCGGTIRRTIVAGRTTYFCAKHQR